MRSAPARPDDFVYLNPPYAGLPRGGHCYHAGGFGDQDHQCVAALMRLLDRRGCHVMASNSDSPATRELYRGFDIQTAVVPRHVGGHASRRQPAKEIIVRNYGYP